ncbi:MAG: hypothetical protein Q3965_04425 [Rothia sp. (in: high G+C Gram-positive bacteria)]|nr:hypothetical protein [Rothia sp. (in: high G+C Gram-positive bacteria)]
MALKPTHRSRSPYLFHFDGQTVALGDPEFLQRINDRLVEQGYATRPTFWDQAYLADLSAVNPEHFGGDLEQFAQPSDPGQLNSVGVNCSQSEFWSAMYARSFANAPGIEEEETLYMPQLPSWLEKTRAWVLDPIAPSDGAENPEGWVRVRERNGSGQPVGLFQLTSPDFFWVFGSAAELVEIARLCRNLAKIRTGFSRMGVYLGYDLSPSSITLPIECRTPLEEELFLAGVDAETLFWEV